MKTFDYAAAWRHAARPVFEALPPDIHKLLARVADEAKELHQLPDLSMPWPADLRAAFDAIPSDVLALASRAVYSVGHWKPGARYLVGAPVLELPGAAHGAHWKFAHYADQVLRGRLGLPESGRDSSGGGLSWAVIEGALRLCYSSHNVWTWTEVCPATEEARDDEAAEAHRRAAVAIGAHPKTATHKRDLAAMQFMDEYRAKPLQGFKGTSARRVAWRALMDTARYMVEDGDQEPPPPDPEGDKQRADDKRRAIVDGARKKIRQLETERDAQLWFLDQGIPTDNLIFYPHTGVFTFGWREPVGPVLLSRILEVISEFPHPYAIKTHDGRTLEGGRG